MAKAKTKTKAKTKAKKSKLTARKRTKLPKRKAATKKVAKKPKKKAARPISKKKSVARKPAPKKAVMVAEAALSQENRIQAGDMAPDFTLNNQNGEPVTLSTYRGRNVILYFYPKDDTPGCTKEACSFRDNIGAFEAANTTILGVSFDDQESHQKFIEKYGLNFQLLSDPNKDVAKAYGVFVQKNMYGNISWGIERSTFVINPEGRIVKAIRRVQVDGHTDEVLESLRTQS